MAMAMAMAMATTVATTALPASPQGYEVRETAPIVVHPAERAAARGLQRSGNYSARRTGHRCEFPSCRAGRAAEKRNARADDPRDGRDSQVVDEILVGALAKLALIFNRMGIDTKAVLKAAGTKWNFLPFRPGLVGGHCIGVDTYNRRWTASA